LSETLTDEQLFSFGWRIPFLASALLVIVGLYVRLKIPETPVFQKVLDKHERVKVPALTVFREHGRELVLGTVIALATFVLFYLMTVFALSWGTTALGFSRRDFLILQLFSVVFFALTIPVAALYADRHGRRTTLIVVSAAIALFGLVLAPMFGSGSIWQVTLFMSIGLALMGMTYGPIGTLLSELFPAEVRYTGSSLTFNFAGILGASLAPYIATWLAKSYGLHYVGYYLSLAALLSLIALLMIGKKKAQYSAGAD
ncbi:MAG: yhjE, partial [Herminiimonas sp.]|nr:yhjE [Herminiimonas sp.]